MLSAQRIGAIIAIERQIGLRNYIEGGIPLDAVLTYDLLVSIFQPSSPLHDGAVIVQDDRVAAAACFLPLTVNPKLSKELGSRHRAAIGLTEENDAVAIVVSEETGSDLARRRRTDRARPRRRHAARAAAVAGAAAAVGEGTRSPRRAVRMMAHLAVPPSRAEGRCRSALAVLLWMIVAGEETVERGLRVPLELQQFPAGLELQGEAADRSSTSACAGPPARSAASSPATSSRCSTFAGASRAGGCSSSRRSRCATPFGVEVVQVTPSSVALVFETVGDEDVPIAPPVEGEPAPGYVVGPMTADPPTVEVIGPESAVGSASPRRVTEAVSVAGAREPRHRERDRRPRSIRRSGCKTPGTATVPCRFVPGPRERTLRDRPVHLREPRVRA